MCIKCCADLFVRKRRHAHTHVCTFFASFRRVKMLFTLQIWPWNEFFGFRYPHSACYCTFCVCINAHITQPPSAPTFRAWFRSVLFCFVFFFSFFLLVRDVIFSLHFIYLHVSFLTAFFHYKFNVSFFAHQIFLFGLCLLL